MRAMRAAILAVILSSTAAYAQQTETVTVTKVLDGGSVAVQGSNGNDFYVRILGVACPSNRRMGPDGADRCARSENLEKCRAKFAPTDQARAFAEQKLLNKTVTLECAERCALLRQWATRYVKLADGSDYSLAAIDQGVCFAAKFHPAHTRQKKYMEAEGKAKKAKVGLHKAS